MLLKKIESEGIIKSTYESSNILMSEYNPTTKDLTVIFKVGSRYTYKDVSLTDYTRFEVADSQGKVLNSHIKAYKFERGENINPELVLNEIVELKKNTIKEKTNDLVSILKQISDGYNEAEGLPEEKVRVVEEYINRYKEAKQ